MYLGRRRLVGTQQSLTLNRRSVQRLQHHIETARNDEPLGPRLAWLTLTRSVPAGNERRWSPEATRFCVTQKFRLALGNRWIGEVEERVTLASRRRKHQRRGRRSNDSVTASSCGHVSYNWCSGSKVAVVRVVCLHTSVAGQAYSALLWRRLRENCLDCERCPGYLNDCCRLKPSSFATFFGSLGQRNSG